MIREIETRLAICCDNCPVQLDLGPSGVARLRNRMPSAWIHAGDGKHYCPRCTPIVTIAMLTEQAKPDTRPQPLL